MVVSALILYREKITDQFENWIKRTVNVWNFRRKKLQEQFFLENTWKVAQ